MVTFEEFIEDIEEIDTRSRNMLREYIKRVQYPDLSHPCVSLNNHFKLAHQKRFIKNCIFHFGRKQIPINMFYFMTKEIFDNNFWTEVLSQTSPSFHSLNSNGFAFDGYSSLSDRTWGDTKNILHCVNHFFKASQLNILVIDRKVCNLPFIKNIEETISDVKHDKKFIEWMYE